VLTKPLGTQIAVNLNQWLDDQDMDKIKPTGMNEDDIRKGYDAATVSMMTLNREASSLMRKYKVKSLLFSEIIKN
jgi:selenophosphate synthase